MLLSHAKFIASCIHLCIQLGGSFPMHVPLTFMQSQQNLALSDESLAIIAGLELAAIMFQSATPGARTTFDIFSCMQCSPPPCRKGLVSFIDEEPQDDADNSLYLVPCLPNPNHISTARTLKTSAEPCRTMNKLRKHQSSGL